MAMRTEYERMLEDAVSALWDELPVEQVKQLAREAPRLVEFIHHLHHSVEHEQAMVRRNYWAAQIDGSIA